MSGLWESVVAVVALASGLGARRQDKHFMGSEFHFQTGGLDHQFLAGLEQIDHGRPVLKFTIGELEKLFDRLVAGIGQDNHRFFGRDGFAQEGEEFAGMEFAKITVAKRRVVVSKL